MTARLIPGDVWGPIDNRGEQEVARLLVQHLDPACLIFHSVPWLRPERDLAHPSGGRGAPSKVRLVEGEIDFLIIDPARGFLVLEVKGGQVVYRPDFKLPDGRVAPAWVRREGGGDRAIKNPFDQARHGIHTIREIIQERVYPGRPRLPGTYGYAVVFPEGSVAGELPMGVDASILVTAKDLPHLGRRIAEIFTSWARKESSERLAPEDLRRIQQALFPLFQVVPALGRVISHEEETLVRLTRSQLATFTGLHENPRVLVEGTAGSGKTMLAVGRAAAFARQGHRTLFLCYNSNLAEWLAEHHKHPDLVVRSFHALCREMCVRAKIPFQPETAPDPDVYWRVRAPQLLDQALNVVPDRFDAIVVDEGQDFEEDWWFPIELLNSDPDKGRLYIFYDRTQNLFGAATGFPDMPVRFTLPANCRNTRAIAGTCGGVIGADVPVWDIAPEGTAPSVRAWETREECRLRVEEEVRGWLKAGSLQPAQIAILGPYSLENSCFAGAPVRVAGQAVVTRAAEWAANKGILYATARGFKGLEADAVVIAELSDYGKTFMPADLYVACSRAKHRLTVFTNNTEMKKSLETARCRVVESLV